MNKEIYEKFVDNCKDFINTKIDSNSTLFKNELKTFKNIYRCFCRNECGYRHPKDILGDNNLDDKLNLYEIKDGFKKIEENPELFLEMFMSRTTSQYYKGLSNDTERSLYIDELLNSLFRDGKARYNIVSPENSIKKDRVDCAGNGWYLEGNVIYTYNTDSKIRALSLNTVKGNVIIETDFHYIESNSTKNLTTRFIYTDKKTNSLNEMTIYNSINKKGELPRRVVRSDKKYEEGESITIDGIWFPVEEGIQEVLEALYSDKNIIENKPVKKTPKPKQSAKPKI
ncbi:TPA: hypothetical protein N0H21_001304 [Pseudomonas aeruginosa]|nr:hypothetical protein [Pseudomonas aeruginosa]